MPGRVPGGSGYTFGKDHKASRGSNERGVTTQGQAEPAQIFARRLGAETGLTDDEREGLTTTFQQLLDLHSQQECQPEPQPAESRME